MSAGMYGLGPLASAYNFAGMSGLLSTTSSTSTTSTSKSSSSASTIGVAASQAASLGLNPSSKAKMLLHNYLITRPPPKKQPYAKRPLRGCSVSKAKRPRIYIYIYLFFYIHPAVP